MNNIYEYICLYFDGVDQNAIWCVRNVFVIDRLIDALDEGFFNLGHHFIVYNLDGIFRSYNWLLLLLLVAFLANLIY